MKGLPFYFFAAAVISVTIGMGWGIQMSASHDHSLAAAHAHLNLIGWVTLALFGIYYHLTPKAAVSKLAKIHLGLAIAGLVLIVPGIVMAVRETGEILAVLGSFLTLGSMVVFLVVVFRNGLGASA